MADLKNVKLHYFNINALALAARLLLHYGNIKYENITMDRTNEWPKVKESMEFQFLPVLEVDGQQFSQAQAIYVYLARKIGNLMGKTDEDEYHIISLLNCFGDIFPSIRQFLFASEEEKKNEKLMKEYLETAINKVSIFAAAFEKRYKSLGNGKYYLGDKLSLADFWLVSVVGNSLFFKAPEFGEVFKKAAPNVSALIERLFKEEPFKSFLESDKYVKGSI